MYTNFKKNMTPLALAAALCLAMPALARAAPTAAKGKPAAAATAIKSISLSTGMKDGKMVFLDEKGQANPVLRANVGDTVEITLKSGEGAQHDIVIDELKVASPKFDATTGAVKVRFKVTTAGKFTYYCSIPGHKQIGMEGTLEVAGDSAAAVPVPESAVKTVAKAEAGKAAAAPKSGVKGGVEQLYTAPGVPGADPRAVSVSMDPNLVPKPIGARAPQFLKWRMETVELTGKLDDGTTFEYWTFDKKVPGPMLRARVGDTIELTLANSKTSKQIHSIDLHSVTGGHGGGEHTQVAPGQEKTIQFKLLNAGLYVYHCATPLVPHHISAGMYGMILVEPEGGLPKVDKEYYVMQGDIYTKHAYGTKGHQDFDVNKMAAEMPDYYVFNGAVGSLTKEHKMSAKVGDTVRLFFGVGGPNKISSFHVIGEIFDKVYSEGSLTTIKKDVQTTLVPAGGATMVEMKMEYPGKFLLVDHALSRAGKGLVGAIEVTGPADANIYNATGGAPH